VRLRGKFGNGGEKKLDARGKGGVNRSKLFRLRGCRAGGIISDQNTRRKRKGTHNTGEEQMGGARKGGQLPLTHLAPGAHGPAKTNDEGEKKSKSLSKEKKEGGGDVYQEKDISSDAPRNELAPTIGTKQTYHRGMTLRKMGRAMKVTVSRKRTMPSDGGQEEKRKWSRYR